MTITIRDMMDGKELAIGLEGRAHQRDSQEGFPKGMTPELILDKSKK